MKNNFLINQYKRLAQEINNVTPQVYAGIALTLSRNYGWENEEISELFAQSQEIWNECVARDIDMIAMCEEETGIECRNATSGNLD